MSKIAVAKTLTQELFANIQELREKIARPASDDEMNEWVSGLFSATSGLAQSPSQNLVDVSCKLQVLCWRLREFLDPNHPGDVLIYLLAESIRDDCEMRYITTEATTPPINARQTSRMKKPPR